MRQTLGGFYETGVSWRKVKAEYIAGGISQRKLAEKYDINPNLLMRHANKEKWNDKRKAAERKALEKVEQKTAEAVADNAALIERAKSSLLRRVCEMIEQYPDTGAQEIRRKQGGAMLKYSLKDIAAVLSVVEAKAERGQSADIEDLAPLAELLRDD